MTLPLSILDLAYVDEALGPREALEASVTLAQCAEARGFRRIWYAEHHNMTAIASSATSVLIAHVAAQTRTIRLGSGGIMLPNHAPLVIAEQFGTLESLHPGRIDLGLGRAPGTDRTTVAALRRDGAAADRFPQDVLELQGYLKDASIVPGVDAIPGKGTNVPLYILGSSLFGAKLAAALGLPFAFASHFAPDALEAAVTVYRREFEPSDQLTEPYVFAGVNVIAAESGAEAAEQLRDAQRRRAKVLLGRGRSLSDEEADVLLAAPAGAQVHHMSRYTAVGTPSEVTTYLEWFAEHARADELVVVFPSPERRDRLRSLDLLADAQGMPGPRLPGGTAPWESTA